MNLKKLILIVVFFTYKVLDWPEGYEVSFVDRLRGRLHEMVLVSYFLRYKDAEGEVVNYPKKFYVYLTS